MVLHQIDGNWVVARTLIGSPAEKAEVLKGQQLLAVDEYEVGLGKGDEFELQALMQFDASPSHRLSFLTSSGEISCEIRKRPLRELLEFDFTNGGATLGYCIGCRTCRTLIQGATDCSSGCPGNRCLIA